MPRSRFAELCASLEVLSASGQDRGVQASVRQALAAIGTRAEAVRLGQLCQRFAVDASVEVGWLRCLARVAYQAAMVDWCESLCALRPGALMVFEAWVCWVRGRPAEALERADQVLASAPASEDVDVAWRARACSMAQLRCDGWREAFSQALEHLTGRARGLCLVEFGYFLTGVNDQAASRSAYAEAFGLLSSDPMFAALTQFNIGMACVQLGDLEAARRAFDATMRFAAHESGAEFLSGAWCGLGAVRRARQEYPRALHAYSMALQKALSPLDRIQAGRGLGHSLRMVGDVDGALEALFEALRFVTDDAHGLYADLAAAKLQNDDVAGALEALERVPDVPGEDAQRALVVRAEAWRRAGNLEAAREALAGVDPSRLWFAEESMGFPELFALVGVQAEFRPMRVRVVADGPVRVLVNDVPLELPPASLTASLMGLLAYEPGGVAFKSALDRLEVPGATETQRAKNLHRAVEHLRLVLGWPDAVLRSGGTLRLDSSRFVCWLPLEAPPAERHESFCDGRFDPWVLEWRDQH